MKEEKVLELEGKTADFKRFGFILLSLSIFLFIGIIVPVEGKALWIGPVFVAGVFIALGFALYFHRLSMKAQKQLAEDE